MWNCRAFCIRKAARWAPVLTLGDSEAAPSPLFYFSSCLEAATAQALATFVTLKVTAFAAHRCSKHIQPSCHWTSKAQKTCNVA